VTKDGDGWLSRGNGDFELWMDGRMLSRGMSSQ
jgi:hypothetical protein